MDSVCNWAAKNRNVWEPWVVGVRCCPEAHYYDRLSNLCVRCPADTVAPKTGYEVCDPCLDGSYSDNGLKCTVPEPIALLICAVLGGVLFGLSLAFIIYKIYVWVKTMIETRERLTALQYNSVRQGFDDVRGGTQCYLMLFADFKSAGRMLWHEEARQDDLLLVIDTYKDAVSFSKLFPVVFLSHQWLSYDDPDPDQVQYNAAVQAVEELLRQKNELADVAFVWLDTFSLPQKNFQSQRAAVNSLGFYASTCKYFIAVAPPEAHRITGYN